MQTTRLSKLSTYNCRNLSTNILEFSQSINLLVGENGNGKTNILEAISLLLNGKSFRKKTSFPQIIGLDCEKLEIIINGLLEENSQDTQWSLYFNQRSKKWAKNGQFKGARPSLRSVFINPLDSIHFFLKSSHRRDWFDDHLTLVDPIYGKNWRKLQRFNRFKSELLANRPIKWKEQIEAILGPMSQLALEIRNRRLKFIDELNLHIRPLFQHLFDATESLSLEYSPKFDFDSEEIFLELVEKYSTKELDARKTLVGVHLDDYQLYFNGLNAYEYCSLGQQKVCYLALLFAYIELFRYKFGSPPLILLDDVSGELDSLRWKNLIDFLAKSDFQIFLTTANLHFADTLEKAPNAKKIYVRKGGTVGELSQQT